MKGMLLLLGFVCLPALSFAQGHHYKKVSGTWRDPDVRVVVKKFDSEPMVIVYSSDRYNRAYRPYIQMRQEIRDQIRYQVRDQIRFQVRDQVRNTFRWRGWHSSHRIRRGARGAGDRTRETLRFKVQ